MNPQLLVVLIFLTSAFTFFSFLMLGVVYINLSNVLDKTDKIPDICNDLDKIRDQIDRFDAKVEKTLKSYHDKLNLIKDRQWVICESMDLKKVVEDWDKNKI